MVRELSAVVNKRERKRIGVIVGRSIVLNPEFLEFLHARDVCIGKDIADAEHRISRHKRGVDDVHARVVFLVAQSVQQIHLVVLRTGSIPADAHVIIGERVIIVCGVHGILVQVSPSDLRNAIESAVILFQCFDLLPGPADVSGISPYVSEAVITDHLDARPKELCQRDHCQNRGGRPRCHPAPALFAGSAQHKKEGGTSSRAQHIEAGLHSPFHVQLRKFAHRQSDREQEHRKDDTAHKRQEALLLSEFSAARPLLIGRRPGRKYVLQVQGREKCQLQASNVAVSGKVAVHSLKKRKDKKERLPVVSQQGEGKHCGCHDLLTETNPARQEK